MGANQQIEEEKMVELSVTQKKEFIKQFQTELKEILRDTTNELATFLEGEIQLSLTSDLEIVFDKNTFEKFEGEQKRKIAALNKAQNESLIDMKQVENSIEVLKHLRGDHEEFILINAQMAHMRTMLAPFVSTRPLSDLTAKQVEERILMAIAKTKSQETKTELKKIQLKRLFRKETGLEEIQKQMKKVIDEHFQMLKPVELLVNRELKFALKNGEEKIQQLAFNYSKPNQLD